MTEGIFKQNTELMKHKMCSVEKQYNCKECGKIFSYYSFLNNHPKSHPLSSHFGEKSSECNSWKIFSENVTFTQHEKIHCGEKPFKFNDCVKTFSRSSLIKHQTVTPLVGQW